MDFEKTFGLKPPDQFGFPNMELKTGSVSFEDSSAGKIAEKLKTQSDLQLAELRKSGLQLDELRKIAGSAEKQAALAEQQAELANL